MDFCHNPISDDVKQDFNTECIYNSFKCHIMERLPIIMACIAFCTACCLPQERRQANNLPAADSVSAYKDTVIIKLGKTYYSPKDELLVYSMENYYDVTLHYSVNDYSIEWYNGEKWTTVSSKVNYLDTDHLLGSKKVQMKSRLFPVYKLSKGKYRIVKDLDFDGEHYSAYAEFIIR